jgi:hypothetical protein
MSGCAPQPRFLNARDASMHLASTSTSTPLDLAAFSTNLSAAVAQQNVAGFGGSTSYTKGVASGHTASTDTDASTNVTAAAAAAEASTFTSSLTGDAVTAYTAASSSIGSDSSTLATSSIAVSRVDVSVDSVSSVVPASGTTVVTTNLDIAHTLNNGVVWEDDTPYVSTVDNATGEITAFVIEDDAFYDSTEDVDQTVDPSTLTTDQLNGTATTSTPTPTPTSTGKPAPAPTATAKPIGPTVVNATTSQLSSTQRAKVVSYAETYWKHYNSNYIPSQNDCTDFVSQALYYGGWAKKTGWYQSDSVWWYDGITLLPKSYTWASAQHWYNFATSSGRTDIRSAIPYAQTGDILQYDVGPVGMNHSMIVTKVVNSMPYLTYHTGNHLNKPFSLVQKSVLAEDSTPDWYLHNT